MPDPRDAMSIRILSICTVFPNANEPLLGTFVNSRLQALADLMEPVVLAPVAALDYSNPQRRILSNWKLPSARIEGKLQVFHPKWFYPPGGGFLNPVFLASALRPLASRLHAQYRFSLIDAHFGFPEGIASATLARSLHLPYAVTLRGNETSHAQNPRIRSRIAETLRGADRVICVSDSLRRFALSLGAPPGRLRTIPIGIDDSIFHPRDRAACRARHQLPTDARIILSAGYLIERKGHHRLVSALSEMPRQFDDAIVVIVGAPGREGQAEGTIRSMIAKMGLGNRVRMLGHVPPATLAELMSAADVFCLASSREGWPNVLNEAMACGAPVVSTDVGGAHELVRSNDLGTIVPVDDPLALRLALQEALDARSDRERIARWASGRSWSQVAREIFDEYRSVAVGSDVGLGVS